MPLLRHPASLRSLALVVGLVVVAAGCSTPGGASSSWSFGPSLPPGSPGASGAASAPPSAAASASAVPSASASAGASPIATSGGQTVELTIGTKTGDELEFDPDSAKVASGALVKVIFENRATTLPHNLTFQAPINAATDPVVAPGTSATFEFTAPAPGDYTWMCTIHPSMQGKLEVDAAT